MRNILILGLFGLVAGCDRNAPPDLVKGLGAPPASSSVAIATPAEVPPSSAAKSPARPRSPSAPASKGAAAASPSGSKAGSASAPARDDAYVAENDPCAGLDGSELDRCLGLEDREATDDSRGSDDFTVEQQRRDRELMERDAEEARARTEGPEQRDEVFVIEEDERYDGSEPGPGIEFEDEDQYAPPGYDDPPPPDEEDYPPPEDY